MVSPARQKHQQITSDPGHRPPPPPRGVDQKMNQPWHWKIIGKPGLNHPLNCDITISQTYKICIFYEFRPRYAAGLSAFTHKINMRF